MRESFSKIKNQAGDISLLFVLVISFMIPNYKQVISPLIIAWLFFTLIDSNFTVKIKSKLSKKKLQLAVIQLIIFFIILLGYLVSSNKEMAGKTIIHKLSLLVFPVLFVLSNEKFKNKRDLILELFVLGNIIAAVICYLYAFYNSISFKENILVFNPYNEESINFFRYSLFSVFHHPAYFSMYLVFSLVIIYYFKTKGKIFISKKSLIVYYLLVIFFSATIFLLSSRIGIISLMLFLIYAIVKFIIQKNKLLYILFGIVIVIVLFIFMHRNERLRFTFDVFVETVKRGKDYKNYPKRLILWESSFELAKENFWTGTGTGDAKDLITKRSIDNKLDQNELLNAHNQFLEIFVSSGIFGLLFLILLFIMTIQIAFKRKDFLFISFNGLILINFFFESMLNTQAGIIFYCFYLNYFIFIQSDKLDYSSEITNTK